MALSPLQSWWFRFEVATEPWVIITSTWFLAELILSIVKKKLRIIHLSIASSCSIFVRPDSILMLLSILPVVFFIYDCIPGYVLK